MHHPALSPAAAREKSRLPATSSGGTRRSHRPGRPSREPHRGRTVAARENPSWQNRPWRSNACDEEAARRSRVPALSDRRVRHCLTPTNGGGGTDPWRTTPRPANTAPYPCRGEALSRPPRHRRGQPLRQVSAASAIHPTPRPFPYPGTAGLPGRRVRQRLTPTNGAGHPTGASHAAHRCWAAHLCRGEALLRPRGDGNGMAATSGRGSLVQRHPAARRVGGVP